MFFQILIERHYKSIFEEEIGPCHRPIWHAGHGKDSLTLQSPEINTFEANNKRNVFTFKNQSRERVRGMGVANTSHIIDGSIEVIMCHSAAQCGPRVRTVICICAASSAAPSPSTQVPDAISGPAGASSLHRLSLNQGFQRKNLHS